MSSDADYEFLQRLLLDDEYRESFMWSIALESERRVDHVVAALAGHFQCDGDHTRVLPELQRLVPQFLQWAFRSQRSVAYFANERLAGDFLIFLHETHANISGTLLRRAVKAPVVVDGVRDRLTVEVVPVADLPHLASIRLVGGPHVSPAPAKGSSCPTST